VPEVTTRFAIAHIALGMRRLNTCTRCILRTSSSLLRVCRAKIESRLELGEGCASIGRSTGCEGTYYLPNPEQRTTNQMEMKTIQRQEPDLGTGPSVKSRHADRGNPIAIPFLSIGHLWGASVQSFHPPTARRARAESEAHRW
jgi:hypothetical protein